MSDWQGCHQGGGLGGMGHPWNLIGHPRCHPIILNYSWLFGQRQGLSSNQPFRLCCKRQLVAFVAFHCSTFSVRDLYCSFEVLHNFVNTKFCPHKLMYLNFVGTLYCDCIFECALFSFVCSLLLEVHFLFEGLKNEVWKLHITFVWCHSGMLSLVGLFIF